MTGTLQVRQVSGLNPVIECKFCGRRMDASTYGIPANTQMSHSSSGFHRGKKGRIVALIGDGASDYADRRYASLRSVYAIIGSMAGAKITKM
jgi:hypothetical protein